MLMVNGEAKMMLKRRHSFATSSMYLDSHCLAFMLLLLIPFHHTFLN